MELVGDVLRDDVLGTYLHGSAVFGGLQPRSDLDMVAVTRRPTTAEERRELIERLMRISGVGDPAGASRSIELTIVVQTDVRPWRYPPPLDFMYGDWWRPEFESGDSAPWQSPNPDLAITLSQVLAADRPLTGPHPADLLDPVPAEDVRRAMLDGIPGLLADLADDTANVVLTMARIWVTLATGEIVPKDAAADWAMAHLPEVHRPVLVRARAVYLGEAEDRWADLSDQLTPHVEHVLRRVEGLGTQG